MDTFYLIVMVIAIFLLVSSLKKKKEYNSKNPETIVVLTQDNKTMRNLCGVFLFFMIFSTVIFAVDLYRKGNLFSVEMLQFIVTPVLFIALYIPLSGKTIVSNIGIYRSSNIIYWDDIKRIEYLVPDSKGKTKARLVYKSVYNKDMTIELSFVDKSEEYEAFKLAAKEYRNTKSKTKVKAKKEGKK